MTIQEALARLLDGKDLTREEARDVMGSVMEGEATQAQIGGLLVALRVKGETADEIAGCAEAMRAHVLAVHPKRDDLVDTAGTLCQAAQALKDEGAERVIAYITHPVLSGKAVERISASALDELVVTDTIPLGEAARKCKRIRVLSVAELLAETMRRIRDEESVSSLYVD